MSKLLKKEKSKLLSLKNQIIKEIEIDEDDIFNKWEKIDILLKEVNELLKKYKINRLLFFETFTERTKLKDKENEKYYTKLKERVYDNLVREEFIGEDNPLREANINELKKRKWIYG